MACNGDNVSVSINNGNWGHWEEGQLVQVWWVGQLANLGNEHGLLNTAQPTRGAVSPWCCSQGLDVLLEMHSPAVCAAAVLGLGDARWPWAHLACR